jgi:hypothetical protein
LKTTTKEILCCNHIIVRAPQNAAPCEVRMSQEVFRSWYVPSRVSVGT